MLALVDAFFEAIYPLPSYAFLHPETTKKRCRDGQFHTALAFALCAVAAQHMGTAGDRDTASRWVRDAEQSIWEHLECPTVPRLQTLLLIIHHRMETGRFDRAFMLIAIAARFVAAMKLNHEHPHLDPVAREVRRRIVWSLKIMERYFAHGIAQFELCPAESIYLDFPLAEEAFGAERQQPAELGAYSLTVRLEAVRRDIIKLTRNIAALHEPPSTSLVDLINHHQQSLDEIGALMPDGTELDVARIPELLQSPWLPRRILMHISFHGAHFDLYRILLHGYPEAAPAPVLASVPRDMLAAAEAQCIHHTKSIINLLTALNQHSSSHRLFEFDTAICVYQALRLLLFIARFGRSTGRPTVEYASSRVDLCIAALRRFFPTSRLVSPIIEELERLKKALAQQRQEHMQEQRRQQLALRQQQQGTATGGAAQATSPVSSSPTLVGDLEQENRLAGATDARERLAIHSLLRQAGFSHGEDDDDQASGSLNLEHAQIVANATGSMHEDLLRFPAGSEHLASGAAADEMPDEQAGAGAYAPAGLACFGVPGASWDIGPSYMMDDGEDPAEAEVMPLPIFPWYGRQDEWDLIFGPQTAVPT